MNRPTFTPMTDEQRKAFARGLAQRAGIDPDASFITLQDLVFRGFEGVAYMNLEVVMSPSDVFAAYQEATAEGHA